MNPYYIPKQYPKESLMDLYSKRKYPKELALMNLGLRPIDGDGPEPIFNTWPGRGKIAYLLI